MPTRRRRPLRTLALACFVVAPLLVPMVAHSAPAGIDSVGRPAAALVRAKRLSVTTGSAGTPIFPMAAEPTCLSLNNYGDPRSGHTHVGLDIVGTLGQPVYAVVDGTLTNKVVYDGTGTAGNTWRLRVLEGTTYYAYLHLDGFAPGLENGSRVAQGDVIGFVGSTGNNRPDNTHLHFEVHPTGTGAYTVNPLTVLTVPEECKP